MAQTQKVRPRRSVLYMPGANTRALEKAKTLPADGLIFDLEDAVAPDAKTEARANVVAAASSGAYGKREVVIRANGLDTEWGAEDLKAIAKSGAHAALIPKVDSRRKIHDALEILDGAGAPKDMALWCMMETPLGMLHAEEVAQASDRVAVWVMGTNDLVKDLHARHTATRLPMMASLGISMLAARAYGITILDGVYNDIKDEAGFADVCRQGIELGFDGKTLIHPSQIGPCNEAFAPDDSEIEFSRRVIEAFTEAQAAGKGVVTIDGRMIENLHVEQARRRVALAEAIAELHQDAAA